MCQAADALRGTEPSVRDVVTSPFRAPRRVTPRRDRLVLLGTAGASNPKANRNGFANAVVVDDAAYIVDCGEGVHRQAWRAGISMHLDRRPPDGATVRSILFTHLHSDHVIDYANLLLGFWPGHDIDVHGPGPAGLPITPYPPDRVVTPLYPDCPTPGVAAMTDLLFRTFAYNINVRIADEGRSDVTARIHPHDIRDSLPPGASGASPESAAPRMEPFVVRPTDEFGVQISAILVQHAPVFPALGYRIDTPNGSVAFSGDTGPCDNVVRLARGAQVLVHEVIDMEFTSRRIANLPNRDALLAHLASSHTSPEDAGRIAQQAGVKTLVMSHLVPGDDEIEPEAWEARARPHFTGEIVCGVDLDEFALDS